MPFALLMTDYLNKIDLGDPRTVAMRDRFRKFWHLKTLPTPIPVKCIHGNELWQRPSCGCVKCLHGNGHLHWRKCGCVKKGT
jgi:hypothetical protein